jgi:NADH dehydrogenase
MAIIGRKWAVADLFKHKLHIGGFFGLMAWLFIHLISLVNYNNKIRTLYSWLVAYLTHDQVLRMIFHSDKKEKIFYSAPMETDKEKPSLLKQHFPKQAVN